MKKILFAASESVPFIKTGGLADVVGSLPKYFDKEKFDVRVMLPKYMCMKDEWKEKLQYHTHFYMDLNWRKQYADLERKWLELTYDGLMTVTGSQKATVKGETVVTPDAVLYEKQPCALSFPGTPDGNQGEDAGEIGRIYNKYKVHRH